ncbi:MAG: TRAP transporter substrate-binding protein [Rhodospirillales bacterium]
MTVFKSLRLLALSMVALALSLNSATAAGKPLTISVIYGPDKPQAKLWFHFRNEVEQALPGAFDFRIVTGGALGGEKETAEGVRIGSINAAESTLANLTTWVPEGALFDMPFMFRDRGHIDRVMAGPVGDEFRQKYAAEGFHVLGYITYGARNIISKQPIRTPEDVRGRKMRVLQSALHVDLWKSLGANPAAVPITEAYNALSSGVVDYMDMTKSGYEALKLYEVVPNFTETSHIWALGAIYMSRDYWQGLTAGQQAVFTRAGQSAAGFFNELAAKEQNISLSKAVQLGASVFTPDIRIWQAAMAPFWESYAPKVGGMERITRIVATD